MTPPTGLGGIERAGAAAASRTSSGTKRSRAAGDLVARIGDGDTCTGGPQRRRSPADAAVPPSHSHDAREIVVIKALPLASPAILD